MQIIGQKRLAKETTSFSKLNQMADQFDSDDDPYALPQHPQDLSKRRRYATLDEEESAMRGAAAVSVSSSKPATKRVTKKNS